MVFKAWTPNRPRSWVRTWPDTQAHLLMDVARVLLYKLGEAGVIWAQFAQPVEDAGLTGVKERQVLGHLWVTWKLRNKEDFHCTWRLDGNKISDQTRLSAEAARYKTDVSFPFCDIIWMLNGVTVPLHSNYVITKMKEEHFLQTGKNKPNHELFSVLRQNIFDLLGHMKNVCSWPGPKIKTISRWLNNP